MSGTRACRDEKIVNDLLPLYLKRRSIEQAQKLAIEYAESMMAGCNTLKQLIRKWPDATKIVPDKYLNSMDDKVPHAPRAAEEPVAIMNMDDAMKSIRLQAEAVRALK